MPLYQPGANRFNSRRDSQMFQAAATDKCIMSYILQTFRQDDLFYARSTKGITTKGFYRRRNIDVKNLPNSLSAKAMEESLANMIVLKWLKSFDDCKFEQAKIFIENKQPAIYQFGIHQYEAGVDWKKWRESDKQCSQKLEDWFNKCFANGEIKKPIVDTKEIYDSVFE